MSAGAGVRPEGRDWGGLLEAWLAQLATRTASEYRRYLSDMLARVDPAVATRDELLLWIYSQTPRGQPTPAVVNARLSAASSFFTFLERLGRRPEHPLRAVRRPKLRWGPVRGLTLDEIHQLLSVLDLESEAGLRDHALIRLQVQTGLRRQAALSLTGASLRRLNGVVYFRVREKGGVYREGPMPPIVVGAIERYLAWRAKTIATLRPNEPVFMGRGGAYRGHSWQIRLKKLAARAGVALIGTHCLRHSGAQLLLEVGATLLDIRDFLGHRFTRTTERYMRRAGQPYRFAEKVTALLSRP